MAEYINNRSVDDAVAEALQLDLSFLSGPGQTRHVPFSFTPCPIAAATFTTLQTTASVLGRLTQTLAEQHELIQQLHTPLADGDPFFAELLSIHRELHQGGAALPRLPLLLQRSDFMIDADQGPQLVECNSIAAGMAPFGEQTQQLHRYLRWRWPQQVAAHAAPTDGDIVLNPATSRMAAAIAEAARQVRAEFDQGSPSFLMVVQEQEDNVFDQRLLERELQRLGVVTYRRTFRQLHEELATGPNQRLLLDGCGAIDLVYLRAGYQYQDYIAADLDTRRCCDALRATRIKIERHRVAVNATIAQQLATSKRMQQYLALAPQSVLQGLGFSQGQQQAVAAVLAEMRGVDENTAAWLASEADPADWVLKNQGEGGGHCLFDQDILSRLAAMTACDYPAWVLMRRLRPTGRRQPSLMVREGRGQRVDGLISEIGIFTAHLEGQPLLPADQDSPDYLGYLVRSKPPGVAEGGVHSGFGMLDSLVYSSQA